MKNREFSPKEKAIYRAVIDLFREGAELDRLTVAEITGKAGIGKGTAYEYFSDKEEMIAKAITYYIQDFCDKLYVQIEKEVTLAAKVDFLLRQLEEEISETNCAFRLVHAITGNSALGRRMREFGEANAVHEIPMGKLIRGIVMTGKQEKDILPEREEYLMLSLFSRILCYEIYLQKNRNVSEGDRAYMRKQVCMGICKEMKD